MSLLDELAAAAKQPDLDLVPVAGAPFVSVDEAGGVAEVTWTVPVEPGDPPPDPGEQLGFDLAGLGDGWECVLNETKLDPAAWTRDTPEQKRAVTRAVVRRRWVFNRRPAGDGGFDVEAAIRAVSKAKAPKLTKVTDGSTAIWNLADWQLGKRELYLARALAWDEGGTEATVARIMGSVDRACLRVKQLRKAGEKIDRVLIVGLGDVIERCSGNYASQAFTTDLHEEDQRQLGLALVLKIIDRAARLGANVTVTAVGGNHGENRGAAGKAYTSLADNADIGLFRAAHQAWQLLAENGVELADRVQFHLPDHPLIVGLDVAGVPMAWTHGHLASGGPVATRQTAWWMKQAFAFSDLAAATVLTTGHYHHRMTAELAGAGEGGTARWWHQAPAQDAGSGWFENAQAGTSGAGMLTMVAGPDPMRDGAPTHRWVEVA